MCSLLRSTAQAFARHLRRWERWAISGANFYLLLSADIGRGWLSPLIGLTELGILPLKSFERNGALPLECLRSDLLLQEEYIKCVDLALMTDAAQKMMAHPARILLPYLCCLDR